MASDMVVALGPAAVGGVTLFAASCYARPTFRYGLDRAPAGTHPLDETIRTTYLKLPQARQTAAVLGSRTGEGWGFNQGVNEHHVAVGVTGWRSRLPATDVGLTGTELVRLALERSHTALQAVDVLTDLISRHGQCAEPGGRPGNPADNIFLVADGQEAFVVEAAGQHWALHECRQVRAVTGVSLVRQDWRRLAPGLVDFAVRQNWWKGDGNKLDFACCLDPQADGHSAARRRWGRATLALEQQNGAIDAFFLRRMLPEQYEATAGLKTHRPPAALAGTFVTALAGGSQPAHAWVSFGVPRVALSFPVWLDGELPAALCRPCADGADVWQQTQQLLALTEAADDARAQLAEALERLQATFDQEAEALNAQAASLRQADATRFRTQAGELMHRHVQLFEAEWRRLQGLHEPAIKRARADEIVSYTY